jgi:hypothetical protein
MHYDLGKERYVVDNGLLVDATARGDNVRVGVNYHFNAPREALPLPLK